MKLSKMTKEDLELLSNKDITYYILEEEGKLNTADLYKKIVTLLELPTSTFEEKIGDYYTTLTTDKRFIMLEDGNWDLRSRHTSDKVIKITEDEEEDEVEEIKDDAVMPDEMVEDNYDSTEEDDDDYDDPEEDLKDLVVVDEDELGLEE